MTEEVWKQVPGYAYYDVSTHGRVRSWSNCHGGRREEPRTLKPALNSAGYLTVSLYKNKQRKTHRMHSLVLTTFIGPRPPGLECCHADGDKASNQLSNLRWDTRAANMRDAIKHGTHVSPPHPRGEKHHKAKLTEADVIEIRKLYAAGGISQRALGALFGLKQTATGLLIQHKTWKHVREID